jgi:hypothetical protein
MKDRWQLRSTHTIDLGYEQLLILEGKRGTRPKVLFRGVWLGDQIDRRRDVPNRDEGVARGARHRSSADLLDGAHVATDDPIRGHWLQWLADAIHRPLRIAHLDGVNT